ncbi:MAG: hypothetical protein LUG85_08960 [Clostridiales bacterium]|nr:hypothetical protein [Clostridiales bacterium]
MQRYEAIENGIKNNDVRALREAIGSICYTSRDFSSGEFDEAIKYVESHGIKLKDSELVGEPLISSRKSTFTDDDFADAVFELKNNFCDERIKDVKTIGKKLYGTTPKKAVPKKAAPKGESKRSGSAQNGNGGTSPKGSSHQNNNTGMLIGLVAVIVVIILIVILLRVN